MSFWDRLTDFSRMNEEWTDPQTGGFRVPERDQSNPWQSPDIARAKAGIAQRLPEPEYKGGHAFDFGLKHLWPEGRRTLARANQGMYKNEPWSTVFTDMLPDQPMPVPVAGRITTPRGVKKDAFLYRSIGNKDEVDAIDRIYRSGGATEVPTSMITPESSILFGGADNPAGLVFSVKNAENIKQAGARDLYSTFTELGGPIENLHERFRDVYRDQVRKRAELEAKLQRASLFEHAPQDVIDDLRKQWLDRGNRLARYDTAEATMRQNLAGRGDTIHQKLNARRGGERHRSWDVVEGRTINKDFPTGYRVKDQLLDLENEPIENLFRKQRAGIEALPEQDYRTTMADLINETIYKVRDPGELVGVKLPFPGETKWDPETVEALKQLAWERKLPIWDFAPQTSRDQALWGLQQLLENPGRFKWQAMKGLEAGPEYPYGRVTTTATPDVWGR